MQVDLSYFKPSAKKENQEISLQNSADWYKNLWL